MCNKIEAKTVRKINYFINGFKNAFVPNYDDFLVEAPGHYLKSVSKKRKKKLSTYEKNRNRQKSTADKRITA